MKFDQHFILSVFHLLFIAPLFLYIGFQRTAVPEWVYLALFSIGCVVFLYHGVKLIMRIKNDSSYSWVNAIHVLLLAPLLIYIGYHKKETPRAAYELLLMTAFAALGYHLFSLVKMLNIYSEHDE
jgi:hypothetical protein|uniref:Uncharacterized protein n=1 Tax=viral metagenome TaxID=1070528 RepID=A0A6C0DFI1_9ZZZZ